MRNALPNRRHAETFEARYWGIMWRITVGYFADHATPGEVFITGGKSGQELEAVTRDGAILLSLAMQHGVEIKTIQHALTRNSDGAASTLLGVIVDRLSNEAPPTGQP